MIQNDLTNQSKDDSWASPELSGKLAAFRNQRVLNLESVKNNGTPVRTPVVFVEQNGRLYFQTAVNAWKAKRVKKNPEVRIAPSTFRGDIKGEWINAKVAKIEGDEAKSVRKAYIRKLGLMSHMFFLIERLLWGEISFFSVNPDTK